MFAALYSPQMIKARGRSQSAQDCSQKERGATLNIPTASTSRFLPNYLHYARRNKKELDAAARILKDCRADASFTRRDDLDQCPATIETTLRRLALIMSMSLLQKRRILLLGDDDLLSVAIAATGFSTRIAVIDLDSDLLSRIERWTKNRTVELRHHDLRLGFPETMAHRYDLVFTDPPYTPAGQLLFLRAGTTAIRNTKSSSIFLCSSRLYLRPNQMVRIITAAERAGLRLVGVDEDFNEYEAPPDVITDLQRQRDHETEMYLHSSLFHFKPTGNILKPDSLPFLPAQIYEYDEENVPS